MRRSGRAIHGFVGKTFTDSLGPSAVVVAIGIALGILVAAALADHRWVRSGLLMGLALIPIVLRWPVIVPFGLYALLLPFDTIQAGFGMTLTKPIGALAIAVLAAASLVERRLRRPPATALWCGLLLIWGIGSAAWAIDPDLVFGRLPTLVGISVLYILAVSIVPSRTEFHWVCALTVIGGSISAAASFFFSVEDREGRVALAMNEQVANANLFTAGLVTAVALAIGGVVALRGGLQRVMAIGSAALIVFAIAISGSRSTFLAVILMGLFLMYRTGFTIKMIVPGVVLSVVTWAMSDTLLARIGLLVSGEDQTGSGRTEIWLVAWQALDRFWVWGAGLGTFPSVFRAYQPLGPRIPSPSTHNAYLQVWTELGICGLILLLAVLLSQLRRAHKVTSAGAHAVALASLEAACVGTLILAFFGDIVWTKQFWWPWILLAWATSLEEDARGVMDAPFSSYSAAPMSLNPERR